MTILWPGDDDKKLTKKESRKSVPWGMLKGSGHEAMLRAAIIEECARVAYECTTGLEACRKIRALKDKP